MSWLIRCVCVTFLSFGLVFPGHCVTSYGSFFNVEFVSCYDGDTCKFNIPGIHPLIGQRINVRIDGIDTPEIRTTCQKERQKGDQAKKVVNKVLTPATNISLVDVRRDKYFRIVSDVIADGFVVGDVLIQHKLAVQYDGGRKVHNWCETEL